MAIDPGASGGIAWRQPNGVIRAITMPPGMTAIHALFKSILMENLGLECYRASASVKFGRHVGNLEAVLYCLGIPVRKPVAPVVWMKMFRPLPTGMAAPQKLARKRAILEKVSRMFPQCKVSLRTADALGILAWALGMPAPTVDWLE